MDPAQNALAEAARVLAAAGLDPGSFEVQRQLAQLFDGQPSRSQHPAPPQEVPAAVASSAADSGSAPLSVLLNDQTAAAVQLRNYNPASAVRFTAAQLATNPSANKCTRELRCSALIDHELGAVVEFPETGAMVGESVAHRFRVDPDSKYRPHHNFQYSLGSSNSGSLGSSKQVDCLLISPGEKVRCKSIEYGCGSLRMCSFPGYGEFSNAFNAANGHYFVSPATQSALRQHAHCEQTASISLAEIEVFRKTFGFYCGIMKLGCSLKDSPDFSAAQGDSDSSSESDDESDEDIPGRDARSPLRPKCSGRVLLKSNNHGHSYLVCEHRTKTEPDNLILRNLQDLDIPYLRALVDGDMDTVLQYEKRAATYGFGPLVPCQHTRSPRSQAQLCPNWHPSLDGELHPGQMSRDFTCSARFRIFEPHDLTAHPFVIVVCTSPHSHPPPERTMTPPLLREAFATLLTDMRWQLADATPRRILQDAGFITNLRRLLNWHNRPGDPTLSELHPSFGNLDHLAYLINDVRQPLFPNGTDFKGAQTLVQQHLMLPLEEQYVRFAAEINLPGSATQDKMVICMFPEQSRRLLDSKRVEVDIAFKRVTSWYEFEMVTWDDEACHSVTLCRAFLTSMSAEAHLALYRKLFEIAEMDTGRKPRFRYLHGDGFEIFTADDDKGHALGLGKYVHELAQSLDGHDLHEPHKRLRDLTPYEHLARFLRLCLVHFKRNIKKLEHRVSKEVYSAMLSLAASESHINFEAACALIRGGGKAASNWLKEKELFGLAALYQPHSRIPLEIWLAGNPTTNGVEQKHRDVNRDGKGLTLLGGINRGMQHDIREQSQGDLTRREGVGSRYKTSDPTHRQYRRIQRAVRAEKRKTTHSDADPPKSKRAATVGNTRTAIASSSTTNSSPSYLTMVPIPPQPRSKSSQAPEHGA